MILSTISVLLLLLISSISTQSLNGTQNDINILNYLLNLEYLESTFYSQYQGVYNSTVFTENGYTIGNYQYLGIIAMDEQRHVELLNNTITALGGKPITPGRYNFSAVIDVHTYLSTAHLLENTGVSAYNGVESELSSYELQQLAASIATVEARHAEYLNQLNDITPFPNITGTILLPSNISALLQSFITVYSTPELVLPVSRNATGTYTNSTTTDNEYDVVTLNYYLTLEHLLVELYYQFIPQYNQSVLTAAGYLNTSYTGLQLMQQQDVAHVQLLNDTITLYNGTAVPPCTYDFTGVNNITSFIQLITSLKSTIVSAYDGAINTITNPQLQSLVESIAVVDAQHSAYLNQLQHISPFPSAIDTTYNGTKVAGIIAPYLKSCPYSIEWPYMRTTITNSTLSQLLNNNTSPQNFSTGELVVGTTGPIIVLIPGMINLPSDTPAPNGQIGTIQTLSPVVPTTSAPTTTTPPTTTAAPTTTVPPTTTSAPSTVTPTTTLSPTTTVIPSTIIATPVPTTTTTPTIQQTRVPIAVSTTVVSTTTVPSTTVSPVTTSAPTNNVTITSSLPHGLGVCNVVDPTRFENPWHGSTVSHPQVYDEATYVCVDGNFLCPSTAPLRCQYACYTSTQYYCENNQLYQTGHSSATGHPLVTRTPTNTPVPTLPQSTESATAPTSPIRSHENITYGIALSGIATASTVTSGQSITVVLTSTNNGTATLENLIFSSYFSPVTDPYDIIQQANATIAILNPTDTTSITRTFNTTRLSPGNYVIYFNEIDSTQVKQTYIYIPFSIASISSVATVPPQNTTSVPVVVETQFPQNASIATPAANSTTVLITY